MFVPVIAWPLFLFSIGWWAYWSLIEVVPAPGENSHAMMWENPVLAFGVGVPLWIICGGLLAFHFNEN